MATKEQQSQFVGRGAAVLADAEAKLGAAYNAVMDVVPIMREGRDLQMAGYLQSSRLKSEARAIAGMIADATARLFALHEETTAIAISKDVDLPQPLDGGGHR